jgi:hypothetical protein
MNEIKDQLPEKFHKAISRIEAFLDLEFPDKELKTPSGVYFICIFFKPGELPAKTPGVILSQVEPAKLPQILHRIADGHWRVEAASAEATLEGWRASIDWKEAADKLLIDLAGSLNEFHEGLAQKIDGASSDELTVEAAATFIGKAGHLCGSITALHDQLALALGKDNYKEP